MIYLWQSHYLQVIGWTLLHTLWQGALVFAAAALAFWLMRDRGPQAKYLAACTSLAVILALAVGTYAYMVAEPVAANVALGASTGVTEMSAIALAGTAAPTLGAFPQIVPWLAVAWMLGVFALSVRLLGGWCWLFGGVMRGAEPAQSEWQWRLNTLSRLLGVTKNVRLLVSKKTSSVLAVGWIKPAVLLPASALLHLSPESLEAILVHELAHVARHDFVVNLLQSIVEVLFFYHPAIWWLSRQVRELREYCCDDAAAKHCGSRASYAGALADLETLRTDSPPQLAPAAKGASLMKRIQRLLGVPIPTTTGLRSGFMTAATVSVIGAGALWGFAPGGNQPQETQTIVIRDGKHFVTKGRVDLAKGATDGTLQRTYKVATKDGARSLVLLTKSSGDLSLGATDGAHMPDIKATLEARLEAFKLKKGEDFDVVLPDPNGNGGADIRVFPGSLKNLTLNPGLLYMRVNGDRLHGALKGLPDLRLEELEGLGDRLSGLVAGLDGKTGGAAHMKMICDDNGVCEVIEVGPDATGDRKTQLQGMVDMLQKHLAQLQNELDGLDAK